MSQSISSDDAEEPIDENILLKEMMELEDEFGPVFDKDDMKERDKKSLWTPIWESFNSQSGYRDFLVMIEKSQVAAKTQVEKMKSKIMKEALRINYGVG